MQKLITTLADAAMLVHVIQSKKVKTNAFFPSPLCQEAEMLRSISFHPSGDFLLVGTQHPTLRLYDVNTFQCFVSCNPLDQHTDTICSVSYNPSANSYVTCSKDGSIKLWDGVSNRCVATFDKAHDGAEVCSAIFSKNSKYILSSGKDSVAKLWEISTGRTLVKYTGKTRVILCGYFW